MNYQSCKRCRRLFDYSEGRMICYNCELKEKKQLEKAYAMLRLNPKATKAMIANEMGVKEKIVDELVKSGEIILSEESPIEYFCSKCNARIFKDNLCDNCKEERYAGVKAAHQEIQDKLDEQNARRGVRMHTRR